MSIDRDWVFVLKQVQYVALAFMLVGWLGPVLLDGDRAQGDLLVFIGVLLGVPATLVKVYLVRKLLV